MTQATTAQQGQSLENLPNLIEFMERQEKIRVQMQTRQTHLQKRVVCMQCLRDGWPDERAIWVPRKDRRECPRCGSEEADPRPKTDPYIEGYLPRIEAIEIDLRSEAERLIESHPVWSTWACHVKGIGKLTLGRLMGHCDISRLEKVSQMWAHAGLGLRSDGTPQRKVKGETLDYDAKLQSITCVLGESLMRARGAYFEVYKRERARWTSTLTKGHAHNRAFRHMRKLCLSHIWQIWRLQEGLTVPIPYAHQYLGHTTFINPRDMIDSAQ